MQIIVPLRNGEDPWTRIQLEKWIRDNVLSKGHAVLIRVACSFNLDPLYAQNICSNLIIHWLLDRIIGDSSNKAENIKCIGEKMGLVSHALKSETGIKKYKVKGLDNPRGDLEEYMKEYHEKLAHFIAHGWAIRPEDSEGIDLDYLDRLLGTSTPQYLPIAPPVIASTVPLPGGIIDPSKSRKTKRVVDPQDIENIKADIENTNRNIGIINSRVDGHESRLALVEAQLSRMKG